MAASCVAWCWNIYVRRIMLIVRPHRVVRIGTSRLTVIVILALVALFIGLRLYSVLGERTGHEQQPILKPADPDARVEPRVSQPSATPPPPAEAGDMAFCRPRARRARDPRRRSQLRRRALPRRRQGGLPDDPRSVLEGRSRRRSRAMSTTTSTKRSRPPIEQRKKEGLMLDNRLVDDRPGGDCRSFGGARRRRRDRPVRGRHRRGHAQRGRASRRRLAQRCGADPRPVDLPARHRLARSQLGC